MSNQQATNGQLVERDGVFYLVHGDAAAGPEGAAGIVFDHSTDRYTGGTMVNQGSMALGDWQETRDRLLAGDYSRVGPDIHGNLAAVQSHDELVAALGGRQHDGILIGMLWPLKDEAASGDDSDVAPRVDKHETITIGGGRTESVYQHNQTDLEFVRSGGTAGDAGGDDAARISGDGVDQDDVVRTHITVDPTNRDTLIIPGPHVVDGGETPADHDELIPFQIGLPPAVQIHPAEVYGLSVPLGEGNDRLDVAPGVIGLDTWEHAAVDPGAGGTAAGEPRPFIMQDGEIVPRGLGDFDGDSDVDGTDYLRTRDAGTKREGPDLDAGKNEVSIETIEIAHEGAAHGGNIVDGADLAVWRDNLRSQPHSVTGDANGDGSIDATDLAARRPGAVVDWGDGAAPESGVFVAAGDVNGDNLDAARTAGPGGHGDGLVATTFGRGGALEPGSLEYPNLAHGGEPQAYSILPQLEGDVYGIAAQDGTSNTMMSATGRAEGWAGAGAEANLHDDPDDGPSTLLRHAAPEGGAAGHEGRLLDVIDAEDAGFTLDGKGTDVNVEEIELLKAPEHAPHEMVHSLHVPDATDVILDPDAGDVGHIHFDHDL